jgi:hypothetical protein
MIPTITFPHTHIQTYLYGFQWHGIFTSQISSSHTFLSEPRSFFYVTSFPNRTWEERLWRGWRYCWLAEGASTIDLSPEYIHTCRRYIHTCIHTVHTCMTALFAPRIGCLISIAGEVAIEELYSPARCPSYRRSHHIKADQNGELLNTSQFKEVNRVILQVQINLVNTVTDLKCISRNI